METLSAPQRVATFLLRFVDDGATDDGGAIVELPYDKQLIAGRIGMTPETLSRSFHRLGDIGVTVQGDEIHIENVASLKDFASSV
jgi:CRP-like cAMP-binding protein